MIKKTVTTLWQFYDVKNYKAYLESFKKATLNKIIRYGANENLWFIETQRAIEDDSL